ncbi:MAG: hypothetical protein NWE78_08495 [Candidatus Bathyarchaeota archaeon]|nr:hypothetical protein [Candidatus Bathyarchaeota archaeon]
MNTCPKVINGEREQNIRFVDKMKHFEVLVVASLLLLFPRFFNWTVPDQWRAVGERSNPLLGVPSIDVFTQRGGEGKLVASPPFCPDEDVILYANVTFSGFPEQNKFVAFQIFDPYGETYILYGSTNGSGVASGNFRLPEAETQDDLGIWTVLATVNVAETIVGDSVDFHVPFNLADVNGDLKVDIFDVVTASLAYGSAPSDSIWNVNCDVSMPYGLIDILDIVLFATEYGQQWNGD